MAILLATASSALAAVPPVATTGDAGPGDDFSLAILNGLVNPEGFSVSECRFEYGTSTEYGFTSSCVPSAAALGEGSQAKAVSASTEPLEPNTTYHYRLLASNVGGSGKGEDQTFTTGVAPSDGCPNAAIRAEQGVGAFLLPDCMALEMVSPPQKFNQPTRDPEISAEGGRVRFNAPVALAETPGLLNVFGDEYVAERGPSGWITQPTSPSAGLSGKATGFTADFSRWLQMVSTDRQVQLGISQAFQNGLSGVFAPLSPQLSPVGGGTPENLNYSLAGASADLSRFYFRPGRDASKGKTVAYLPGDPSPAGAASDRNTYVAYLGPSNEPLIALLARDSAGKVWGGNCGSRLGGIGPTTESNAPNGERNQGAISTDGTRAYFSARASQPQSGSCSSINKLRILKHQETSAGPQIAELFHSECTRVSPLCSPLTEGDDLYQGASVDGTKVYFTTNRQLANSDLDGSATECNRTTAVAGCDLYLYDSTLPAGHRLVQVSAGEDVPAKHEAGKEARIYSAITAISGDGSHVYFVAEGVLSADQNPEGNTATSGQPNLYLWDRDSEETSFLGTLTPGDSVGLWGNEGAFRNQAYPVPVLGRDSLGNEVGGDGHILLFESKAALTADDADDGHLDVFRYDAVSEKLVRVSMGAPGGSDNGAFDVAARAGGSIGPDFAEAGRWVSEDGEAVVFKTAEGLLPGDVNGALDDYLWRAGRLARLPGTTDSNNTLRDTPVIAHDGTEVAFQTFVPLLPGDGDTTSDIYVARSLGGFPSPLPPKICVSEECQGPLSTNPGAPDTRSERPVPPEPGPGCPKGKIRRHGKCVKRQRTAKKRTGKAHRNRASGVDGKAAK